MSTNCALVSGCYFGWEDLPGPGADDDFNDLVFALQFTPISSRSVDLRGDPVPEPGTLTLLCVGLLGLGFITHRRAGAALSAAWVIFDPTPVVDHTVPQRA